jgi:hypothetical protein
MLTTVTRAAVPVLAVLQVAVSGCSKPEDTAGAAPNTAASDAGTRAAKRKAEKLETAVPYGKHVACSDLFPLTDSISRLRLDLGEVRDAGRTDSSATSVCLFFRAKKTGPHKSSSASDRISVPPGEEYCMIRVFCSLSEDADDFLARCEKRREVVTEDLGFPACVRVTMAGEQDRYSYKALDPDTGCRIEVSGGPTVTGEEVVKRCLTGAVDIVVKDRLTNFH